MFGDCCNDPRIFARRPDFHFAADVDKPMAAEARRRLLDMAATDKILMATYHAPFPAVDSVLKDGAGYNWFPANYSPVI